MTYSDVKKAGLTLTEVSIPHRFWTARFQVGAIEDPAAAISAAYGWFQSMVDDLAEPIVTRAIQPPKEPGERLGPPKSQAAPVDDDGLHETEILQYALQKKPDGKYLLEMYPNIKGRPGQWPEVRFTAADQVQMWQMVEAVQDDIGELPCQKLVAWIATWRYGKQKPDSDQRYKDLVSVRPKA